MATNLPPDVLFNPLAQFDAVATEIVQTFELLIAQLIARRDALLHKLSQLREDYITMETTLKATIQELKFTRQQLERMDLKVNTSNPFHPKASELYQQTLDNLLILTKLPYPIFQCPTLQTLQNITLDLGDVLIREIPDYSMKTEPTLTGGKKGKMYGFGISIDEANKLIYLCEREDARILVMSFEGKFITRFGQRVLKSPNGIAVTEEDIFVSDMGHHSLFQFHKKSRKLKNKTGTKGREDGELNNPIGLSIDTNGDAFVADCMNHRISIFSKALQFKMCFGAKQLRYPQDVRLTKECVVVLDFEPSCIHTYSRNGTLLTSCISHGTDEGCMLYIPHFLCLDPAGNMFISESHVIKIFSKSGQYIHTIGKRGHKKGEFDYLLGDSVSQLGTIFVLSGNPNYPLQCF